MATRFHSHLGIGGAIGAGLGAILGGLAAVGTSLAIPGLGIVIGIPHHYLVANSAL